MDLLPNPVPVPQSQDSLGDVFVGRLLVLRDHLLPMGGEGVRETHWEGGRNVIDLVFPLTAWPNVHSNTFLLLQTLSASSVALVLNFLEVGLVIFGHERSVNPLAALSRRVLIVDSFDLVHRPHLCLAGLGERC